MKKWTKKNEQKRYQRNIAGYITLKESSNHADLADANKSTKAVLLKIFDTYFVVINMQYSKTQRENKLN